MCRSSFGWAFPQSTTSVRCVCARVCPGGWLHDYCAPCVCLCVPRRGGCINIVRCPQRHTGRLARGGPRRRRSSWLEKISDKGLILKAFSLCVQGLHQSIVGLWPSAKSACKRDYARVQHRRATAVRAAQISQILGGKSANLSQVDVSRRTQWRGLPHHLAGTVRPAQPAVDWLHQRQPTAPRRHILFTFDQVSPQLGAAIAESPVALAWPIAAR